MTLVWIDRTQAKTFRFSHEKMERQVLAGDDQLFAKVGELLTDARRILITGPGETRVHFLNWLRTHMPSVANEVLGCEVCDQSSDAEIAALALKYLRRLAS